MVHQYMPKIFIDPHKNPPLPPPPPPPPYYILNVWSLNSGKETNISKF